MWSGLGVTSTFGEKLTQEELSAVARATYDFCLAADKNRGSALSCADFVTCLYFSGLARLSLEFRDDPDRDKVVFSKGHGWAPQLFALWLHGYFDDVDLEALHRFGDPGNQLPRVPARDVARGIEMSAGSLGQGLSYGAGLAASDRFREAVGSESAEVPHTFVILGDAECGEGQVWEAANTVARLGLRNLTPVIDANGFGNTISILRDQWAPKLSAFGFDPIDVDGQDHGEICAAIKAARESRDGRPKAIILRTIKGYSPDPELEGTDYVPALAEIADSVRAARDVVRHRFATLPSEPEPVAESPAANRRFVGLDDFEGEGLTGGLEERLAPERGLFLLSPDALLDAGLSEMKERWGTWHWDNPESLLFECPVAEQDTATVAAGLAASRFRSAIFLRESVVWRMLDSLRESIVHPQLPVVTVASAATPGADAEARRIRPDTCISAVSSMPGLEVFEAADTSEARFLFTEAVRLGKPAYVRIPPLAVPHVQTSPATERQREPKDPILEETTVTEVAGRSGLPHGVWTIEDDADPEIVLVAAGAPVGRCREVACDLRGEGIRVRVLNLFGLTRAMSLPHSRLRRYIPDNVPALSVYNGPAETLGQFLPDCSAKLGVSSPLTRPAILENARDLVLNARKDEDPC